MAGGSRVGGLDLRLGVPGTARGVGAEVGRAKRGPSAGGAGAAGGRERRGGGGGGRDLGVPRTALALRAARGARRAGRRGGEGGGGGWRVGGAVLGTPNLGN